MIRYAIRHAFPDGRTVGDGYIHAGDTHPQPIAPFYGADAEATAARMREHNPGHVLDVVPYPLDSDPWLPGLAFDTPTVNRSKLARRSRTGRMR